MLAQVTYIQRFIMADSEDEFMLDARRPADATIFGTHINDARQMPHDDRPMQNRPVGRLSEFPA